MSAGAGNVAKRVFSQGPGARRVEAINGGGWGWRAPVESSESPLRWAPVKGWAWKLLWENSATTDKISAQGKAPQHDGSSVWCPLGETHRAAHRTATGHASRAQRNGTAAAACPSSGGDVMMEPPTPPSLFPRHHGGHTRRRLNWIYSSRPSPP